MTRTSRSLVVLCAALTAVTVACGGSDATGDTPMRWTAQSEACRQIRGGVDRVAVERSIRETLTERGENRDDPIRTPSLVALQAVQYAVENCQR